MKIKTSATPIITVKTMGLLRAATDLTAVPIFFAPLAISAILRAVLAAD